jgi:uncharacterized membrane protein
MVFTGMLLAWVVVNTVVLARVGGGFDPYPYIFLNLIRQWSPPCRRP